MRCNAHITVVKEHDGDTIHDIVFQRLTCEYDDRDHWQLHQSNGVSWDDESPGAVEHKSPVQYVAKQSGTVSSVWTVHPENRPTHYVASFWASHPNPEQAAHDHAERLSRGEY